MSVVKETGSTRAPLLKLVCVEFPKFNGEKLNEWLYMCEHFFEYDETPDGTKVKVATIYLEGKALQWHQNFMRNRLTKETLNRGEYTEAIATKFGSNLHNDPMAELKNPKQWAIV